MAEQGFTLFETALGPCALVWGDKGIVGAQLPERTAEATRARIQKRYSEAREGVAPALFAQVIARIRALMAGERIDLADSPLDLTGLADFDLKVYRVALAIPPGETLTYGEVARRIGEPHAAQAVGQSLGRNPFPPIVPCHRVLAASGRTGGFSAPGGVSTKLKLLSIERARTGAPTLFDDDPAFGFAARPR